VPSVLWRCWLGGRKGIQPVKNWVVGCWHGYLSGVTCIRPSWCHCHSLSLAPVKFRLVLPSWYRLTRVVLDKGPLNACVCVYIWISTVCRCDRGKTTASVCSTGPAPEAQLTCHSSRSSCSSSIESSLEKTKVCFLQNLWALLFQSLTATVY